MLKCTSRVAVVMVVAVIAAAVAAAVAPVAPCMEERRCASQCFLLHPPLTGTRQLLPERSTATPYESSSQPRKSSSLRGSRNDQSRLEQQTRDAPSKTTVADHGNSVTVWPWTEVGRLFMAQSPQDLSGAVLQAVGAVLRAALENNFVVLLHDGQHAARKILEAVLESLGEPLVLVDLRNLNVTRGAWLGAFNSGRYVHIVVFSDSTAVEDFLEAVPQHTWVPRRLLFVNANWSLNAAAMLSHHTLRYSAFLTLLQPKPKADTPTYLILTYESYRPRNKVVQRGEISSQSSGISLTSLFPDRFATFHGHRFHLSSWVDDYPYIIPGKTLDDASGISIKMLSDIAHVYNFTYQVYELPQDGLWGDLTNGTWRGMVGEIKREERDLCVNVIVIEEAQFHAVDFSVPYNVDGYSALLRNPRPPPRWWSFTLPLSVETWVVVVLLLLLLPLPLFLFLKVYGTHEASLGDISLEVLRALLHQDPTLFSAAISFRTFVGSWWLAAMVLSISYTMNLVAYITVPPKPHMLTSVEELADSDITPVMLAYGSVLPGILMNSVAGKLKVLGERLHLMPTDALQQTSMSGPYERAFALVQAGTHTLLEGAEYLPYTALKHRVRNVYILHENLFPVYVGWIFPKHTPWKYKFDFHIQRFVEGGFIIFWKNEFLVDMRKKLNLTENTVEETEARRPLSLDDLKGVFFAYLAAVLLVVVAGVLELIQHRLPESIT